MKSIVRAALLIASIGVAHAQAPHCAGVPRSLPVATSNIVALPLTPELVPATSDLSAPRGVLSQAYDEAYAVDRVLLRMKIEACRSLATVPAPTPLNPNDPAAYKPQTQWDNTPWRFNMTQNGKRMTADEFDAWMKAKGVRVVPKKPEPAATAVPPATQPPQQQ